VVIIFVKIIRVIRLVKCEGKTQMCRVKLALQIFSRGVRGCDLSLLDTAY
jgi:hypothetical protein